MLDLLFREEDMVQKNFNSVVFAFSAHLSLLTLTRMQAVRLLELIRAIHRSGVFHGDMHACNVMFSNPNDILGSMRIIDSGSGGFLRSQKREYQPAFKGIN